MIKRFVFARNAHGLSALDFEAQWLDALAHSPAGSRPLRAVVCTVLQPDSDANHDGVSIEWFSDLDMLQGLDRASCPPLLAATHEVIAQEVVLRGAGWLEQRWLTREPKYKHMALARRADGLTPTEFSERWRNRPGRIGGGGGQTTIAIPEAAKGSAYCQNHSLLDSQSADPAYDAINEVYFDRLEDMQSRLEFFRDHPVAQLDVDLVREPRFLIVRERVVNHI